MFSWHTISSPFVSINNIYNIFCFDINSPTPKVFIDFIVKVSCFVRHIDCMASTKLKRGKFFLSFNFFLQSYVWRGFPWRSNFLPIYIQTIFYRKGPPFVYLLLTNGTPFTHLNYNFATLLAAVNSLSFHTNKPLSQNILSTISQP